MPLWKQIAGYEGTYEISDEGQVRSARRKGTPERILKFGICRGYLHACLSLNGEKHTRPVHRLVAETFLGPVPNDKQVNHKDGIKANNKVSNLEWVTPSENLRHAFAIGNKVALFGEDSPVSKATEKIVSIMRRSYAKGISQNEIAKRFGFHQSAVSRIINGKRWKHSFATTIGG